jgi:hypothetical protein
LPGDRFELPGVPRPGGYVGKIVLTEGWRGRRWTPRTHCEAARPQLGAPAHTVEPSTPNGYAYRCLRRGHTGETEPGVGSNPPWPTRIGDSVNDGEVLWECVGAVPRYTDYGLIVDRGSGITTDNTRIILASYPLIDNTTTLVDVSVTAFQSAGPGSPDGATFVLRGAWCRGAGGAPIEVKAPVVLDSSLNHLGQPWVAMLVLSGNNAEVRVSGNAGKTIRWTSIRQGA